MAIYYSSKSCVGKFACGALNQMQLGRVWTYQVLLLYFHLSFVFFSTFCLYLLMQVNFVA